MANKKIETRILAYIDLLGFKEISKENPNICLSLLKKLHQIKAKEITEQIFYKHDKKIRDKQVSVFSDLIVISYPAKDFYLLNLCIELSFLLQELLFSGVLARGVITVGSLYHKQDIIYGESLIEAYEIERSIVKYPRVILTDKLLSKVFNRKSGIFETQTTLNLIATMDADGFYSIDPLKLIKLHPGTCKICRNEGLTFLRKIKGNISKNLNKNPNSLAILSKWRWFANYFNNFIEIENISQIKPINLLKIY